MYGGSDHLFGMLLLAVLLASAPGVLDEPPSFVPTFLGTARPTAVPDRIVSVAPSATELVFELGAGPRVVGVSRYDDFPAEVEKLPKVGGFLDPSVEAIVALRPKLVVAVPNASNRAVLERVAGLSIPVLVIPGNSFSDVLHAARALAPALGPDALKRANALEERIRRAVDETALRASRRPRLRAALLYDAQPLVLAGPGSFADTMFGILNLGNIVTVQDAYPKYSTEALVAAAPEVIFDASRAHGSDALAPLAATPAGRNKWIVRIDDHALLRSGPRLPEALRSLESALTSLPRVDDSKAPTVPRNP